MTTVSPFFSVCVPVYNAESYLTPCLSSIVDQNFTDMEMIIINDGSTDGSQAIIDTYKALSSVKALEQTNQGIFQTRLRALQEAKGKYVLWLDADDYLEPGALSVLHNLLSTSQADVAIYNNYDVLMDGTRRRGASVFEQEYFDSNSKHAVMEQFVLTSKLTALWRKAVRRELFALEKITALPAATMGDDWLLSYYPLLASQTIVYTSQPLVNYRILPTSLTSQYDTGLYQTLILIHELSQQWLSATPMTHITSQMLTIKYLQDLSKAIAYIPGQVKDEESYLSMLNVISSDKELRHLYGEYKPTLSILYRLPFELLYRDAYKSLLQLKRLSAILRKRK